MELGLQLMAELQEAGQDPRLMAMVNELRQVESFQKADLLSKYVLPDDGPEVLPLLWDKALKILIKEQRAFLPVGPKAPGHYRLAGVDRRIRRISSREKAAMRIIGRQKDEAIRLHEIADNDQRRIVDYQRQKFDLITAGRKAARKRPKGLD